MTEEELRLEMKRIYLQIMLERLVRAGFAPEYVGPEYAPTEELFRAFLTHGCLEAEITGVYGSPDLILCRAMYVRQGSKGVFPPIVLVSNFEEGFDVARAVSLAVRVVGELCHWGRVNEDVQRDAIALKTHLVSIPIPEGRGF